MKELDIHRGNPSVDEAIDNFYDFLKKSYKEKCKIIKIITGYGSNSGISRIKDELILELEILKKENQITEYIWGNELLITSPKYIQFTNKSLIPENEKRILNRGCVFIII